MNVFTEISNRFGEIDPKLIKSPEEGLKPWQKSVGFLKNEDDLRLLELIQKTGQTIFDLNEENIEILNTIGDGEFSSKQQKRLKEIQTKLDIENSIFENVNELLFSGLEIDFPKPHKKYIRMGIADNFEIYWDLSPCDDVYFVSNKDDIEKIVAAIFSKETAH